MHVDREPDLEDPLPDALAQVALGQSVEGACVPLLVETQTLPAEQTPYPLPATHEGPTSLTSPLAAISVLAAAHFLVDISASTINPLWQGFEERFHMRHGSLLWVTAAWTISNSIAQLLFAWWADRVHQRWLLWVGAAVGIICLSCAGFAPGPWPLALLLVTGGLGIAAFHPEAATASGAVLPEKRSRMMAIFALAGYLGQSIGPYYSGRVTTAFGLSALIWGGLVLLAALTVLASQQARVPLPGMSRPRHMTHGRKPTPWGCWGLLLATGTLRIAPAIGVPLVIAYWLTDRELIGTAQSVFMGGIGAGSILCALAIRTEWERTVLWLLPLAAAPFIAAIPETSGAKLLGCVGASGLLLGVSMPVFISFGQQLLPDHPRAASSITMGVSWGTAGGAVAKLIHDLNEREILPWAFFVLAAASASAGLLGGRLTSPRRTSA